MTLTVRSATVTGATTKGSPLTHAELDENFNHLSQASNHSVTQSGTGAVANTTEKKLQERVTFDDFLTTAQRADAITGSPSVDMTAKMQAALDSGAKVVEGVPGRTYLVSQVGTKTFRSAAHRYCLLIPDGVTVDLRGSTVKLAASANAAIFMNSTAGTTQNTDIGFGNGVLDGNETNQTTPAAGDMPCIHFYDVLRPRVTNLRVVNARQYFGRFLLCEDVHFDRLYGKRSDGDGWSFGVAGDYNVLGGFIDNIYAEDCTNGTYGSLQGNGVIGCMERAQVGKLQQVNCGGGTKIQPPSDGLTSFAQLTVIGGANGTTNSGVKIQGQSGQADGGVVSIGQIITELNEGEGLDIEEADNVQIGSFKSFQDGQAGTTAAFDIDETASNVQIGTVYIEEAQHAGADIDGTNVKIGSAIIKNSGQDTVTGDNLVIAASADGVRIGSYTSIDDQGSHTARRGLNIVSGAKNLTIDEYHSRGDYRTAGAHHVIDAAAVNVHIGRMRIDDDDLYARLVNSTQAGNVGDGEDDLQSVTIAARSFWRNGQGYRITAWGLTANNSNPKTIKVYFGGTAILTTALTVSQTSFFRAECHVIRTGASTQAYSSQNIQPGTANIFDVERGTLAVTETDAIIVKTTATVTDGGGGINNDDLICYGLIVEPIE